MPTDEQEQIADSLADRAARRRAELKLDPQAASPIGAGIAVEAQQVTCECGERYVASLLRGGDKVLRTPSRCSACRTSEDERNAKRAAEADATRAALAQERAARQLAKRITELAVPPLYADVSLQTFRSHGTEAERAIQRRAFTWAVRYLAQFPDVGLLQVLSGGFGTGKGHIAWSIAKAGVHELGWSARVVKLPVLVRELRDTWSRDRAQTYEQVLEGYTKVDFLVVDEVSRHAFYGQQIHQHLYDVIDTRIEYRRPTLLTTNEDEEGLIEVIRPALFNRLQGEGGIVPFGDASWRSLDDASRAKAPATAEVLA